MNFGEVGRSFRAVRDCSNSDVQLSINECVILLLVHRLINWRSKRICSEREGGSGEGGREKGGNASKETFHLAGKKRPQRKLTEKTNVWRAIVERVTMLHGIGGRRPRNLFRLGKGTASVTELAALYSLCF